MGVLVALALVALLTASASATGRRVVGYVLGAPVELTVAPVSDGKVLRSDAAAAFAVMQAAAAVDGVTLRVVSAFRTQAEQAALRAKYEAGTGNLAALPGWSDHQGGVAVDLDVSSAVTLAWLRAEARTYGFVADVPTEAWHWHFVG